MKIRVRDGLDTDKLAEDEGQDYLETIERGIDVKNRNPGKVDTNWMARIVSGIKILSFSKDPLLKGLASRIEAQGYAQIGAGSDAYAFDLKDNKVLRVCMLYRKPCIEGFVSLVQRKPNKHFPKIYGSSPFESNFYATVMERLNKVSAEERTILDGLLSVAITGSNTASAENVRSLMENQPKLLEAFNSVLEERKRHRGWSLDCNRGRNIMKRGLDFVIVDPFYFKQV